MKNCIRVAICVMLVVAFLAMSLSVFAVDPTPSPTPTVPPIEEYPSPPPADVLWGEAGNYLVWLILQSWGIEISETAVVEYTDTVRDTLTLLVEEFLATLPSPMSIISWVEPWAWSSDFWGNFRFNSSMLEDVDDFRDWLVEKFNLGGNSVTPISPAGAMLEDIVLYSLPIEFIRTNGQKMEVEIFVGTGIYCGFVQITDSIVSARFISDNQGTVTYIFIGSNGIVNQTTNQNLTYNGGNKYLTDYTFSVDNYPDLVSYEWYTNAHWNEVLSHGINPESDIYIITNDITPPDYDEGDSLIIIDGRPEYEVIEWDGTVSVSNLPAIVSTGTIESPGLDTFWGFIPVLAEETKDAIVLTRGLIYEMPEELVVTFFAVMGGLILFGVIKLMREH